MSGLKFPTNLRQIREQRQLTQSDLARLCDLSEKQIGRYERGVGDPTIEPLTKIAKALSVSSDYLLGLTDDPGGQYQGLKLTSDEHNLISLLRKGDMVSVLRVIEELVIQAQEIEEHRIGEEIELEHMELEAENFYNDD